MFPYQMTPQVHVGATIPYSDHPSEKRPIVISIGRLQCASGNTHDHEPHTGGWFTTAMQDIVTPSSIYLSYDIDLTTPVPMLTQSVAQDLFVSRIDTLNNVAGLCFAVEDPCLLHTLVSGDLIQCICTQTTIRTYLRGPVGNLSHPLRCVVVLVANAIGSAFGRVLDDCKKLEENLKETLPDANLMVVCNAALQWPIIPDVSGLVFANSSLLPSIDTSGNPLPTNNPNIPDMKTFISTSKLQSLPPFTGLNISGIKSWLTHKLVVVTNIRKYAAAAQLASLLNELSAAEKQFISLQEQIISGQFTMAVLTTASTLELRIQNLLRELETVRTLASTGLLTDASGNV